MVKRKKRKIRGIESIEKQIKIHEEKREEAIKNKNEYLAEYYGKEINSLKKTKERMKEIIDKL